MPHYGDYQNEIYGLGLRGIVPKVPVNAALLEERAIAAMPPYLRDYVQGGCGDEHTQRSNSTAFQHWGMVPRMMVDASERDLSIDLFGLRLPSPIFMSPIGVTGLCTPDGHGDMHAARASAATGVPMMVSTLANDPLEEVAKAVGDTPAMFQLYTPRDKDLAESLVRRAEAAGYKAIVVTLDTWVTGWRPRDLNAGNFPQLRGHVLTNYFRDPVFRKLLGKPVAENLAEAVGLWARLFGKVLTWDDMAWLKSITRLPIVLKGICHPDDARRAVDAGADGIFCSNHGGRQANGGIAAIDMLADVVQAAGDVPVLFDSGVRSGTDVVKALALGARAVGIGRPFAYGLVLDGADGAAHVLKCILAEADLLMAVNGYPTLGAVRAAGVKRV
ncbi:alpha-hydroxy-acid oxidizing protein [Ottowia sp.]|jgi:lactate 2-monooxygenase|uniref:alpha-hydroxy-acid oxidizing protein n=1 Tax=Ottowia sp. TaxID=1898956 RepID=UPI0025D5F85E|nr:alpha-hydroxy-acid oxidizing protein [Ottowia sp.]MBK6615072.1 alpha-hydroxy-acid oxidizing protein [Ottowia sp.]MBK6746148.1 alpha-hydroxy-acid oxidizing protein [Ottowia sp.]